VDLTALLDELEAVEAGAVIPDEEAEPVPPRRSDAPTVFLQIQEGHAVLKDHAGFLVEPLTIQ